MERELMTRAWSNLLQVLEKVRAEGERALDELAELDAKRRIDGRIIEGSIAEYCRCGKKECPDLGKCVCQYKSAPDDGRKMYHLPSVNHRDGRKVYHLAF